MRVAINMIEISVKSKRYSCVLQLHQKVTVIVGNSGRGKTIFTKAIEEQNEAYKITVSETSYKLVVLSKTTWHDVVSVGISTNDRRIYIIDDMDFITSKEFSDMLAKDKTCYYVLISRFTLHRDEVYEFCTDGENHWLEKYDILINI